MAGFLEVEMRVCYCSGAKPLVAGETDVDSVVLILWKNMIDASYPSVETIDALFLVHKRRGSQRSNLPVRMEKNRSIHPFQSDCSLTDSTHHSENSHSPPSAHS